MTAGQGEYGGRKIREGTVVSDKMEKTVVVAVHSSIRHRLYKKTIRRVKKYMAHDENETAKTGDLVRIVESAPVSKHKRWRVAEVLTRIELPEIAPEAIDSTLVEDLAAPIAPPVAAAVAVAAEEMGVVQADAPPEALEQTSTAEEVTPSEPEVPPVAEVEPVQADAPPEALEQISTMDEVTPSEPEVPPVAEVEPVEADAGPEATEADE
jgi:small subunit ribosomal protein S17